MDIDIELINKMASSRAPTPGPGLPTPNQITKNLPIVKSLTNEVIPVGDYFKDKNECVDGSIYHKVFTDKDHSEIMGKLLKKMQDDSVFCDVSLNVKKSDNILKAHKCVLAANSRVLYHSIATAEANMKGDMEKRPICLSLTIDTDSIEALESLVQYMYTGELNLNPYILEDILTLSESLSIDGILALCSSYLQGLIDISNWMWLNRIAVKYNLKNDISSLLQRFAIENFVFLVQNNELLSLDIESLLRILNECNSENNVEVEAYKLEMILKWINYSDERSEILSHLLKYVNRDVLSIETAEVVISNLESLNLNLNEEVWQSFLTDIKKSERGKKSSSTEKLDTIQNDFNVIEMHDITEGPNDTTSLDKVLYSGESDSNLSYENDISQPAPNECQASKVCRSKQVKKNKASVKVRLKNAKNKCKKTTRRSKTCRKLQNSKSSSSVLKLKKPRTKTSFTQVNQTQIFDEYDTLEDEQKECDEPNMNFNSQIKTELDSPENEKSMICQVTNDECLNQASISPSEVKPKVALIKRNGTEFENLPMASKIKSTQRVRRSRTKKAKSDADMYSCEKCPRKFLTPSALNHHLKGHGAKHPFLCEICGFSTIHFASMNVHRKRHNEKLRFHCSYQGCDYSAIRSSRLDDHMSAHFGIKNHVCSVCGKAFTSRKHLHRHEQIHTGDRHGCGECAYQSPRRDKLRDHIKKHHPATAIMQGFMTTADFNKPKPPPKPRKARSLKSKKTSKIQEPQSMEIQLEEERMAEDQKAVESIDHEPVDIVLSPPSVVMQHNQLPVIQVPQHLLASGQITEEVIQYITANMAVTAQPSTSQLQQSTTIQTIVTQSQNSPVSLNSSHSPAMAVSEAQQLSPEHVVIERSPNRTVSALTLSSEGESQPEQQQWYNFPM